MTYPPARAEREAAKEARDKVKDEFRRQDSLMNEHDIKLVMKTPEGRRLFMTILYAGGIYSHSRMGHNVDYRNGRRDAALEVLHMAEDQCPELVMKARQERLAVQTDRYKRMKHVENETTKPGEKQ